MYEKKTGSSLMARDLIKMGKKENGDSTIVSLYYYYLDKNPDSSIVTMVDHQRMLKSFLRQLVGDGITKDLIYYGEHQISLIHRLSFWIARVVHNKHKWSEFLKTNGLPPRKNPNHYPKSETDKCKHYVSVDFVFINNVLKEIVGNLMLKDELTGDYIVNDREVLTNEI